MPRRKIIRTEKMVDRNLAWPESLRERVNNIADKEGITSTKFILDAIVERVEKFEKKHKKNAE